MAAGRDGRRHRRAARGVARRGHASGRREPTGPAAASSRHLENATDPIWGLDTVPSPAQGVVISQVRVPEDLEYFPLDENRTPETDNGVHNSAVLRETMFNQIVQLFSTGELVHPCDGLCDPD